MLGRNDIAVDREEVSRDLPPFSDLSQQRPLKSVFAPSPQNQTPALLKNFWRQEMKLG